MSKNKEPEYNEFTQLIKQNNLDLLFDSFAFSPKFNYNIKIGQKGSVFALSTF